MKTGVALLLAALVGPCFAQAGALEAAPSAEVACLTPAPEARGQPEYPEDLALDGVEGRVVVELEFRAADLPPVVTPVQRTGDAQFEESVNRYIAQYRIPCLAPERRPLRLTQEFVFVPNPGRKVTWTAPHDRQQENEFSPDCVKHVDGLERPEMPREALQRRTGGIVRAHILFKPGVAEPEVTVTSTPPSIFDWTVVAFAKGYRFRCGGGERRAVQTFHFKVEDTTRVVLRDMPVASFLAHAQNAKVVPVYFDLDRMGCPFDVRMVYEQPAAPNRVGEFGPPVRERRPFLDWLSTLRLRLAPKVEVEVVGNAFTISVPCGKIDL